jgi:hypothetical protein
MGSVFYFCMGLMYHLVMSSDAFSWSNPWLYVDMTFWPVFLLGWFVFILTIIIGVCFVVFHLDRMKIQHIDKPARRSLFRKSN